MPVQLSRSDQKILLVSAGIFVLLIAAAFLLAPEESNQETVPSTYSSNSSGAKAAFQLLKETGFIVERWEQPLTDLKTGKNNILILAEPKRYGNKQELRALHEFIRKGGTLIAVGPMAALMLPETSHFYPNVEDKVWDKYDAVTPSSFAREASQITMETEYAWESSSSALALYGKDGKNVVVAYPYGDGKVIWWAAATPLTNAGLKEPQNLEFFLACLGDKANVHIFWDEYFHGFARSAKISFAARLAAIALAQLVLLSAAVLWTFSRRSGPVRPSEPEIRLSPLEFVETLGGLYKRAHASATAVDICYQRFLYWLARRLGVPPTSSVEEFTQTAINRWNFLDEEFAPTFKECAQARYRNPSAKRALHLVRSLHSYAVQLNLYSASSKEKK
jgi:hypothetical protein